jgi:hypothetical protein
MAAGQDAREVDWAALAAPVRATAPWRPAPGADAHEHDWAGAAFSLPGPTQADEARQLADAEAWGGRGPSASYTEWLAEGRQPEHEAEAGQ